MVLCSSCDGVPLKFKKKNRRASSLPARITYLSILSTPLRIRWTIPFKEEILADGKLYNVLAVKFYPVASVDIMS
jgi:hypothetical protein